LRKTVEASRFQWQGHSFQVGVSIGLVPITRAMTSITDLLSAADSACYTAKDLGRNRIHVYDQADTTHLRRHREMRWAARIDQALENDGLTLAYQSIRPLSQELVGEHIEILLRLKDDDGTDGLPAEFMRAAERYDLASRVDRWVIDHCLQWLESRPDIVERLAHCAINVSSRSIDDDGFVAFLHERLDRSTVPAQRLCIEITETSLIGDLGRASAFMVELKARGCKFALDDFGSGVSSFAYLKRLPVDYVKIDGSFVRNVVASQSDRAIVRSINEVAHSLGTRTVAECVESRAVEDALRALGVDFAQGYAIANVRPLASFE
jgi:EAL domain-containing protein (putative c-di-GMP-specific phosphodiesterase class I)